MSYFIEKPHNLPIYLLGNIFWVPAQGIERGMLKIGLRDQKDSSVCNMLEGMVSSAEPMQNK